MKRFHRWRAFAIPMAIGLLAAHAALASGSAGGHDVLLPVLEALVLVLLAGRLGGSLFTWLGMPSVLGELVAGAALAALVRVGLPAFDGPSTPVVLDTLAQLGVLFLLFSVGLESDVGKLAAVARSALLVAVVGVVVPMALGIGVSAWLLPGHDWLVHAFIGATLSATSVGLTARVLQELGRAASLEGRIILGAAVIDDVLGLLVLAAVSGVITATDAGRQFSGVSLLMIVLKAVGFLAAAVFAGRWVSTRAFAVAARMRGEGLLLTLTVAFCFTLSWLAGLAGLAPIVGAFAAGLVLEEMQYKVLLERETHARNIEQLLAPISQLLVPVFFVLMGMAIDVTSFARPETLVLAAVLTIAAVVGKQACSLAVMEKGADRIAVGLGMIPRGEVGLIFASIGRTLHLNGKPVIDGATYSAVVLMVVLTTLVTPPLLAARLKKSGPPPR